MCCNRNFSIFAARPYIYEERVRYKEYELLLLLFFYNILHLLTHQAISSVESSRNHRKNRDATTPALPVSRRQNAQQAESSRNLGLNLRRMWLPTFAHGQRLIGVSAAVETTLGRPTLCHHTLPPDTLPPYPASRHCRTTPCCTTLCHDTCRPTLATILCRTALSHHTLLPHTLRRHSAARHCRTTLCRPTLAHDTLPHDTVPPHPAAPHSATTVCRTTLSHHTLPPDTVPRHSAAPCSHHANHVRTGAIGLPPVERLAARPAIAPTAADLRKMVPSRRGRRKRPPGTVASLGTVCFE